jgi:hypothetical protein
VVTDLPDPATVIRVTLAGFPPGVALIGICRRSTAARMIADADPDDRIDDLGPWALLLARRYDGPMREALGRSVMRVGVAHGAAWLQWFLPSFPREPVPGQRTDTARRN